MYYPITANKRSANKNPVFVNKTVKLKKKKKGNPGTVDHPIMVDDPVQLASSLAKLLQYFCNGHVTFQYWARLTGHLCLITESGQTIGFAVNESVGKLGDDKFRLSSNSFHVTADTEDRQTECSDDTTTDHLMDYSVTVNNTVAGDNPATINKTVKVNKTVTVDDPACDKKTTTELEDNSQIVTASKKSASESELSENICDQGFDESGDDVLPYTTTQVSTSSSQDDVLSCRSIDGSISCNLTNTDNQIFPIPSFRVSSIDKRIKIEEASDHDGNIPREVPEISTNQTIGDLFDGRNSEVCSCPSSEPDDVKSSSTMHESSEVSPHSKQVNIFQQQLSNTELSTLKETKVWDFLHESPDTEVQSNKQPDMDSKPSFDGIFLESQNVCFTDQVKKEDTADSIAMVELSLKKGKKRLATEDCSLHSQIQKVARASDVTSPESPTNTGEQRLHYNLNKIVTETVSTVVDISTLRCHTRQGEIGSQTRLDNNSVNIPTENVAEDDVSFETNAADKPQADIDQVLSLTNSAVNTDKKFEVKQGCSMTVEDADFCPQEYKKYQKNVNVLTNHLEKEVLGTRTPEREISAVQDIQDYKSQLRENNISEISPDVTHSTAAERRSKRESCLEESDNCVENENICDPEPMTKDTRYDTDARGPPRVFPPISSLLVTNEPSSDVEANTVETREAEASKTTISPGGTAYGKPKTSGINTSSTKSKSLLNKNGHDGNIAEESQSLICHVDRRIVPKTNYNETTAQCPFPWCDSRGHLNGRSESHRTFTTCPLFNDTTAEECKLRYEVKHSKQRKKMEKDSKDGKVCTVKTASIEMCCKEAKPDHTSTTHLTVDNTAPDKSISTTSKQPDLKINKSKSNIRMFVKNKDEEYFTLTSSVQPEVADSGRKSRTEMIELKVTDPQEQSGWLTCFKNLREKGFFGILHPWDKVVIVPPRSMVCMSLKGEIIVSGKLWTGINQMMRQGCREIYLQMNETTFFQVNLLSSPYSLKAVGLELIGLNILKSGNKAQKIYQDRKVFPTSKILVTKSSNEVCTAVNLHSKNVPRIDQDSSCKNSAILSEYSVADMHSKENCSPKQDVETLDYIHTKLHSQWDTDPLENCYIKQFENTMQETDPTEKPNVTKYGLVHSGHHILSSKCNSDFIEDGHFSKANTDRTVRHIYDKNFPTTSALISSPQRLFLSKLQLEPTLTNHSTVMIKTSLNSPLSEICTSQPNRCYHHFTQETKLPKTVVLKDTNLGVSSKPFKERFKSNTEKIKTDMEKRKAGNILLMSSEEIFNISDEPQTTARTKGKKNNKNIPSQERGNTEHVSEQLGNDKQFPKVHITQAIVHRTSAASLVEKCVAVEVLSPSMDKMSMSP